MTITQRAVAAIEPPAEIPKNERPISELGDARYGRLRLIKDAPRRTYPSGETRRMWELQCDCGRIIVAESTSVKRGDYRSCGCLRAELRKEQKTTHGMSHSPEYRIWYGMIRRCTDPKEKCYPRYGGRGINVCEEWLNDFSIFYAHVGPRPSKRHSLDRIDNEGSYVPGNVRWATPEQQGANTRRSIRIPHGQGTIGLREYCNLYGISADTVKYRTNVLGWSLDDAVWIGDGRRKVGGES